MVKHSRMYPFNSNQIYQFASSPLRYPRRKSCLVMRIKQMIIHRCFSKMKNKILLTCLQGNYRDSLGEFSNKSYGVFGAERVNTRRSNCLLLKFFFCYSVKTSFVQDPSDMPPPPSDGITFVFINYLFQQRFYDRSDEWKAIRIKCYR